MRKWRAFVANFCILVAAAVSVASSAAAHIRATTDYSSFVNPVSTTAFAMGYFGVGGIFSIAGGVVFDGKARFFLENGNHVQPAPINLLSLVADKNGSVQIRHKNELYNLEIHTGLACPLGTFIARGGLIAYTVPDDTSEAARQRMKSEGLEGEKLVNAEIAKEFAGGPFDSLLDGTDFAETVDIPDAFKRPIIDGINKVASPGLVLGDEFDELGSYINTDAQVTYKVYLVAGVGRVDTEGVPFRYYWDRTKKRTALVDDITAFSQDWPSTQRLSQLPQPWSQYDFVSLYQNAGIFREFFNADASKFRAFVADACRR